MIVAKPLKINFFSPNLWTKQNKTKQNL